MSGLICDFNSIETFVIHMQLEHAITKEELIFKTTVSDCFSKIIDLTAPSRCIFWSVLQVSVVSSDRVL